MSSRIAAPSSVNGDRTPRGRRGRERRVQPEERRHRREEIGHRRWRARHAGAVFVGRASNDATANAAAGKRSAPCVGPVVAPVVGVDARRAPEFAHTRHERRPEAAATTEVTQQRGERRVQDGHLRPGPVEVVLVRVPPVEHDLDELHAALDEPACHETPATEVRIAVSTSRRLGLAGHVEGVELWRVHQTNGLRVDLATPVDLGVAGRLLESIFHRPERREPPLEARPVDPRGQRHVRGRGPRLLQDERSVRNAEKPGAEARPADADERRKRRLRVAEAGAGPRAEGRMQDGGVRGVAGVDVVLRAAVVALLARHAANERDLVGALGESRQVFAQGHAGRTGLDRLERPARRATRFGVERVDVARAAVEPQEDAGRGLRGGSAANAVPVAR